MWLLSRTRAIFRRAEFGFFGVMVRTIVQTPRFWGAPRRSWTKRRSSEFHVVRSAGVSTFGFWLLRPLRTSCEIVGMRCFSSLVIPFGILFSLAARARYFPASPDARADDERPGTRITGSPRRRRL